jgi:hypothetical protein
MVPGGHPSDFTLTSTNCSRPACTTVKDAGNRLFWETDENPWKASCFSETRDAASSAMRRLACPQTMSIWSRPFDSLMRGAIPGRERSHSRSAGRQGPTERVLLAAEADRRTRSAPAWPERQPGIHRRPLVAGRCKPKKGALYVTPPHRCRYPHRLVESSCDWLCRTSHSHGRRSRGFCRVVLGRQAQRDLARDVP